MTGCSQGVSSFNPLSLFFMRVKGRLEAAGVWAAKEVMSSSYFFPVTKFASALDRMAKARVKAAAVFGSLTICDILQALLFIQFFPATIFQTCLTVPYLSSYINRHPII